jgi:hypothetical protein
LSQISRYGNKKIIHGDVDILKYTNVEIIKSNNTITLYGNWFIVDCTDEAYYHFLFDNVGQYYALKEKIPGLRALLIMPDQEGLADYVDWCVSKIVLDSSAVVISEGQSVEIENLYVASNRLIPTFALFEDQRYDLVTNDAYQDILVPALRKFLLKYLPKHPERKKIYAVRRDKSYELSERIKFFDYLRENGVTWDSGHLSDPKNILFDLPEKFKHGRVGRIVNSSFSAIEMDTNTRYIKEEDEALLEEYLDSLGYEFMSHKDISFEDQMSMIASCESYVCITGASVLNSIVCPEDASIYIINTNTNWPMPNHEYTPTIINNNSYTIFSTREFPNTVFEMKSVISRLNEVM